MKEFLETLYKLNLTKQSRAMDELWNFIAIYQTERKFEVIDQLMVELDLSKIDTSLMYCTVMLCSNYNVQLTQYSDFYNRVREEYARRGETEKRIKDLFDRFRNGGDRPFNPQALPHRSHEEIDQELLDDKIALAHKMGDKDLVRFLEYYKSHRERDKSRDLEFSQLRQAKGDEEIRKDVIASLRQMADLLESSAGSWPGIYYCKLPEKPLLKKTFIDGIDVTISYPWPG